MRGLLGGVISSLLLLLCCGTTLMSAVDDAAAPEKILTGMGAGQEQDASVVAEGTEPFENRDNAQAESAEPGSDGQGERAHSLDSPGEEWTLGTCVLLATDVLLVVGGISFWCLRRGE